MPAIVKMRYNRRLGRYTPYVMRGRKYGGRPFALSTQVGAGRLSGIAKFGRKKTKFDKAVVRSMQRYADTKAKYMSYLFGNVRTFGHDILHSCILATTGADTSIPTSLSTGAGDSNRVGSDVHSVGFRIRGSFGLPFDRRNTMIKIWMVEWNSNQGNPVDPAQFFRNVTGNHQLDPINTERFPGVKLLKVLRAKARDLYVERGEITDSGSIHQIYYNLWIPFKRRLRYQSNQLSNPTSGMKENLSIIMSAYDTYSAVPTDNVVVDHDQSVTWYYKDV